MPSRKTKLLKAVILESDHAELQAYLRDFAQELASEILDTAPDRSEEVLSTLIAELALSVADQRRSRERRQRQAEGIAAAKANGVQFGRRKADLPEDFEQSYQAWLDGQMSLRQAAKACGMVAPTFRSAALRRKAAAECAAP